MKKNLQIGLGALVVLALAAAGYWYIQKDLTKSPEGSSETVNVGGITVDADSADDVVVTPQANTISADESQLEHPNLDRELVFSDSVPAEVREIVTNNIANLTALLTQDPKSFQQWMQLATQYKVINDFEMVRAILEFLNEAAPQNTIARVNLGNLYHYELKEYEKSEAVFNEALAIDSKNVDIYTGLFELYKYSYKTGTTLAEDTLKAGVEALPENTDLHMLLAGYYADSGRTEEARALYNEVRTIAEKAGNTNLITIVDAALANLK